MSADEVSFSLWMVPESVVAWLSFVDAFSLSLSLFLSSVRSIRTAHRHSHSDYWQYTEIIIRTLHQKKGAWVDPTLLLMQGHKRGVRGAFIHRYTVLHGIVGLCRLPVHSQLVVGAREGSID